MSKLEKTYTHIVTDADGNFRRKDEKFTTNWGSEPQYVKVYLEDVMYLVDMPKHHSAIVYELLKRASYADKGMEVVVNSYIKKSIKEKLSLKGLGGINNALTDLVKAQVLFRIASGVYRFNPYLFGRGDWQDIAKLRLEINYDLKGKTFRTVCQYKSEQEGQSDTPQCP